MTFSISRLIHRKWRPLEDIEARDTCCTKREAQSENFLKHWYSLMGINGLIFIGRLLKEA